ncbi:MAG: sigma-70 family RNA polymerase sigma factor [Prevotella sp.]|nr:sigma-70 family RNA polymerase sigma factor [Prevotella sp.]
MKIMMSGSQTEEVPTDFDALFRMYYAPMVLFATRMVKEKETAEDMVQEVFMQLLSRKDSISVKRNMRNYLITILHNRIIDLMRRNKNLPTERINEQTMEETVEETAFEVDLYARLYEEIEKLPVKNAQVMKLKMEGKDNHEIADILGIKYETVRSHVKHAISSLRNKFDITLLLALFG